MTDRPLTPAEAALVRAVLTAGIEALVDWLRKNGIENAGLQDFQTPCEAPAPHEQPSSSPPALPCDVCSKSLTGEHGNAKRHRDGCRARKRRMDARAAYRARKAAASAAPLPVSEATVIAALRSAGRLRVGDIAHALGVATCDGLDRTACIVGMLLQERRLEAAGEIDGVESYAIREER